MFDRLQVLKDKNERPDRHVQEGQRQRDCKCDGRDAENGSRLPIGTHDVDNADVEHIRAKECKNAIHNNLDHVLKFNRKFVDENVNTDMLTSLVACRRTDKCGL